MSSNGIVPGPAVLRWCQICQAFTPSRMLPNGVGRYVPAEVCAPCFDRPRVAA